MAPLDQYRADRSGAPVLRLDDSDLKGAARCVVETWAARFDGTGRAGLFPGEFGLLEPYLAEVVVMDHGADFAFCRWGAALDVLCGGGHFADRLSDLPQPSRGHLRRVCVRAAATRAPAISKATWALEGEIWRCAIMALPTETDDFCVRRLLVALLFAPHPLFTDSNAPEGFGWPAAILRGSVHGVGNALPHAAPETPRQVSPLRAAAQAFRRLLSGHAPR